MEGWHPLRALPVMDRLCRVPSGKRQRHGSRLTRVEGRQITVHVVLIAGADRRLRQRAVGDRPGDAGTVRIAANIDDVVERVDGIGGWAAPAR